MSRSPRACSRWAPRQAGACTGGVGIIAFIAAFACLIGMQFAVRRSLPLTVGLLGAFGLLTGLAVAPTVAYYGSMDPAALWQAGGATALFIAGLGAAGYATRRDLAPVARASFWALAALIVVGIVLIFVHIPGADLAYSVLGLVIFAGFTLFDFQRARTSTDVASAPLLAASIFLDIFERVPVLPADLHPGRPLTGRRQPCVPERIR